MHLIDRRLNSRTQKGFLQTRRAARTLAVNVCTPILLLALAGALIMSTAARRVRKGLQ